MNTAHELIVQNTNTALQDAGIQYSITIFGNQRRYLSWAVSQVNLMFLFISYFKLLVILASSSHSYFAVQMTQELCKLTRKNQQGKVVHNDEMLKLIYWSVLPTRI